MADRPSYPGTDDDGSVGPTADGPPSTPLWVKVFGIVGVVLVLLVVVMLLFGGGNHGPGRHMGSHAGGHAQPSVGAEHGAKRS